MTERSGALRRLRIPIAAMLASCALAAPATAQAAGEPYGSRDLRIGMSGSDVKTLNWLLQSVQGRTTLDRYFKKPTYSTVRSLQANANLPTNGVVDSTTRSAIGGRMLSQNATWYGPGFWGNRTACGRKLKKKTIGVAHKKLPCGTKVTFAHGGRYIRAKVIDRGPYNRGYKWDLTKRLAKKLGFISVGAGPVSAAVVWPR